MQFSYDQRLLCWQETRSGVWVVQAVMPDRDTAQSLADLMRQQDSGVGVAVRQSSSLGGRWVVQLPVGEAADAGWLPRGMTVKNFKARLRQGSVVGDAVSAYSLREADAPPRSSWLARLALRCPWHGSGRSR
jgi:hypothetical protein